MNINSDNIFRIENERYGKSVATNGEYVAIGNPNPYDFDIVDGFTRIGEVYVYKKNTNVNEDYTLQFKCTSSLDYNSSRGFYVKKELENAACDGELKDESAYHYSILYQSKYGNSIDIYKNIMVVGDYECIVERIPCDNTSFVTFGKVDIYNLFGEELGNEFKKPIYTLDPLKNINKIYLDETNNNTPRFGKPSTADFCKGFGYSVAISSKYIFVGCPFSIDKNAKCKNQLGDRNRHGVVFAYAYKFENDTFTIENEVNPDIIVPVEPLIRRTSTSYRNFGYYISTDKSDLNSFFEIDDSRRYQILVSTHEEQYRSSSASQPNDASVYLFKYKQPNMNLGKTVAWIMVDAFYPKKYSDSEKYKYADFTEVSTNMHIETELTELGLFGISTVISNSCIFIGAPKELTYTEYKFDDSSLSKEHNRGSVYSYYADISGNYIFNNKIFGGKHTFKDNLFGISLDIIGQYQRESSENIEKIAIGSPRLIDNSGSIDLLSSKLYYSKFLYDTINKYVHSTEDNIFEPKGFNGQVILYKISKTGCDVNIPELNYLTTYPVSSRKVLGESFNAFGYSVALSDINLVVGAPVLLYDNFISRPIYENEARDKNRNENDPDVSLRADVYDVEDDIFNSSDIIFTYELESEKLPEIRGRAYIYNKSDLVENHIIGGVFYNNNRIVINTNGNICKDIFKLPDLNKELIDLHGTLNSRLVVHELQYICTINPGEFNIPTNITARKRRTFNYSITNTSTFTFTDLDYILRFISMKVVGKECWWCPDNIINKIIEDKSVDDGVEESIFEYYKSTVKYNFSNNPETVVSRLTPEISEIISKFDLDVNKDGMVSLLDAKLIWKHFIKTLTIENYESYINRYSKRNDYDEIIRFLDNNFGKGINTEILDEFFNYAQNNSNDPTGSYLAPYITQIGLFRNAELIAFAKLAHPIKNTGELPINIVIKCDV